MTTWLTSDLHIGHTKVIEYSKRPFSSVEEMNEKLIFNYNELVKPSDDVYILGDLFFCNPDPLLFKLKGRKHLITGNHDYRRLNFYKKSNAFIWIKDVAEVKIDGISVWLSHYAHRTWNKSHHGAYHFWGHSHGTLPDYGRSCDVGVDCWNYKPVSFEQLADRFKNITQ